MCRYYKNNHGLSQLVDDEADILEFIRYNLEKEDYEVFTASNGREAVETALRVVPHLILLDVMMPEMDGIETCREIRSHDSLRRTLIAFLTARGEDYSQIAGFDAGADDYITKPFGVMELISRVKALLRRIDRVKKEDLNYGTIRIDVSRHTVQVDGNEVELTYKEYEILKYLMKNRGIVLTRASLMEKIWGYDFEHGNRTVDVHIQSLRKKLGTAGDAIKTIRNVGYKIGD